MNAHRRGPVGPLRITGCMLIAAPAVLFAAGCGAVEAVGNFPNPKDTVTVYTTPPPRPPAAVVSADVPQRR